ncbi:MAG: cobyrinic acid a,c-diamide synthase [Deltaproteobacteria bacterium SG8_13]|nr:MAG: cobyrinic acid a,c-diamide synthase [Deltaproteobacteria bacterium SG8_13]
MLQDGLDFPRLLISALRGGSGKTILSIGIIAALLRKGRAVFPFKKGPDYIDAGWLSMAAGRSCYNLDTFMVLPEDVRASFLFRSFSGGIAVIEGNRGLYDGIDLEGSTSTAELAKLLQVPVVLCVDATKTTRTMAAVIAGCQQFDSDVRIGGVVLNRVAGARHESILRRSIETHCRIPVFGAIPKLGKQDFPERHMGLVPTPEHRWALDAISAIADVIERHVDLAALEDAAGSAPPLHATEHPQVPAAIRDTDPPAGSKPAVVGVIRDAAFQFYYPENLEALEAAGAQLVYFSPLETETMPDVDALYIGGGFPETHAEQLAGNTVFKKTVKTLADDGLPIYAECGGLMYLGQELVLAEKSFPMAGVLPIVYGFSKKPQGHGYTIVTADRSNPYFPIGGELRGHEFHYSRVLKWSGKDSDLVFQMKRGAGIVNGRDGAVVQNVLATYTHLHALGAPGWAPALVRRATAYRRSKKPYTV